MSLLRAAVTPEASNRPAGDMLSMITQTLKLAEKVAEASHVPYVKGIIATAVHVLETAQDMRENRSDAIDLSSMVANLVLAIENKTRDDHNLDEAWHSRLANLTRLLEEIDTYMTRLSSLPWFKRAMSRTAIKNDITRFRLRLDDSTTAFGIISQIDMKQHLSCLERTIKDIINDSLRNLSMKRLEECEIPMHAPLNTIWSGSTSEGVSDDFTVYHRRDIELEKSLPISESTTRAAYLALVRGQRFIVKSYSGVDSGIYHRDMESLKGLWHPNIEQLVGHSHPQSVDRFLVIRGGIQSVETCIRGRKGLQKLYFAAKLVDEYVSAQAYLHTLGMYWHQYRMDDLMVDGHMKLYISNPNGENFSTDGPHHKITWGMLITDLMYYINVFPYTMFAGHTMSELAMDVHRIHTHLDILQSRATKSELALLDEACAVWFSIRNRNPPFRSGNWIHPSRAGVQLQSRSIRVLDAASETYHGICLRDIDYEERTRMWQESPRSLLKLRENQIGLGDEPEPVREVVQELQEMLELFSHRVLNISNGLQVSNSCLHSDPPTEDEPPRLKLTTGQPLSFSVSPYDQGGVPHEPTYRCSKYEDVQIRSHADPIFLQLRYSEHDIRFFEELTRLRSDVQMTSTTYMDDLRKRARAFSKSEY